ncbi:MAG: hypothetical protein ACFFD4_36800 [Candidatus Odinarchaeota archaeon]
MMVFTERGEHYSYASFENYRHLFREIISLTGKYHKNQINPESGLSRIKRRPGGEWEGISKEQYWKLVQDTINEIAAQEYPITLYQAITDPWEFVLRVDTGEEISQLQMTEFNRFGWIFLEGDTDVIDYRSFKKKFLRKLPNHHRPEQKGALFKYRGKFIDQERALRLLYHAFCHPEQHVRETLTDELDRLLETYDGWGEGKKI